MTERFSINQIYTTAQNNLRRNYESVYRNQLQLATGKRINRASDDVAGTGRLLGLSRQGESITQFLRSVESASRQVAVGSDGLQEFSNLVQRIRELAVQGANGTLGPGDRRAIASEITHQIDGLVSAANSRHDGRYLFGGTETTRPPYELITGPGGLQSLRYLGNEQIQMVDIAPASRIAVNIPGPDIFTRGARSGLSFDGTTGALPGSGTSSITGRHELDVAHDRTFIGASPATNGRDPATGIAPGLASTTNDTILGTGHTLTIQSDAAGNGSVSLNGGPPVFFTPADQNLQVIGPGGEEIWLDTTNVVPLTPATTLPLSATGTLSIDGGATTTPIDFTSNNQAVTDSESGEVLYVDATGITGTGIELVESQGTFDIFDAVIAIRDTLDDPSLDNAEVSRRVNDYLAELDRGFTDFATSLAELGSRSQRLESTQARLEDLQVNTAIARGEIEDADLSEVITALSESENLYQSSLLMASRIGNLSLLNYI